MNKKEINTRGKGRQYEALSAAYLTRQGYRIVQKNFQCRSGEIDIIAWDGPCLCFIEVKYRKRNEYGNPFEAVTKAKQKKIVQTALYYRLRYGVSEDIPCRFDVVGVEDGKITLLKNAFTADSLY